MEILFKNRYTRNRELAKEIYRFFYFQRKRLIGCYILFVGSFLGNLFLAISGKPYRVELFAVAPLFFVLQLYCYARAVRNMIKYDHETHGKEIEVETIVTPSYIQTTSSNGAVGQIAYESIKSVFQTNNLILLGSKARLVYIFRKNTFDVGTKEAFLAFLRAKGIRVQGK